MQIRKIKQALTVPDAGRSIWISTTSPSMISDSSLSKTCQHALKQMELTAYCILTMQQLMLLRPMNFHCHRGV